MPTGMNRSQPAHLRLLLALALLVGAALPLTLSAGRAGAERTQRGHLIVAVGGGISPLRLPRHRPAPVALRIGGRIQTDDGSPLPRIKRVRLAISGRGVLDTRGLPVCPRARLRTADNRQALARCGSALVGRGSLQAEVFVPHQAPFPIHSALLAFNGRTDHGGPAVWVHAFAGSPPISIVLPFLVHRRGRHLSTVLSATVPRSLGSLPHLAGFQITFDRRFRYRDRTRSYLSASCPVPSGFTAGFLAFAKATYSFADGRRLGIEAVRSCRAR